MLKVKVDYGTWETGGWRLGGYVQRAADGNSFQMNYKVLFLELNADRQIWELQQSSNLTLNKQISQHVRLKINCGQNTKWEFTSPPQKVLSFV